nr:hypothetical protein CFP56_11717 [Quercus suber]
MENSAALSKGDRTLRQILMVTWIPAFAFLLAHGIISGKVVPVLSIIPMTFSVVTSAIYLLSHKTHSSNLAAFADTFIVAFLVGTLAPGWVMLSDWRSDPSTIIVGTYGTAPCLVNLVIHAYYVLCWLSSAVVSMATTKNSCPHCDGALSFSRFRFHRAATTPAYEHVSGDEASQHSSEESFKVAIADQETAAEMESVSHEPRPSTDDETARLV